jgi:glycosyltransferase involved in cell wall biosynthesis
MLVDHADTRPTPAIRDRAEGLRIALFSGNYNCVRDGANKALNRLVAHLLDQGAAVRVYSPAIANPAFPPAGDLVPVRSVAIPGRPEFRLALGLPGAIKADIARFAPTHIHLSAPDPLGTGAQKFARKLGVPVVASLHTRFETYFDYYGLSMFRGLGVGHLRRFYQRSDHVLSPNQAATDSLVEEMGVPRERIGSWSRGVDPAAFHPAMRDLVWRRAQGFADDEIVLLFFGRVVLEKGIDIYARTTAELRRRGLKPRPLIVGAGPAEPRLRRLLPDAIFAGHLESPALGGAVASADILLNPSITEAFGNVNLEAMAAGLAIVSADVGSAQALITHGASGLLVSPELQPLADATESLIRDPSLRARLGQAAHLASTRYRWDEILNGVIDSYHAIAGAGVADRPGACNPQLSA